MKKCSSCHKILTLDAFYVARNKSDGCQTNCKKCSCKAVRKWLKETPKGNICLKKWQKHAALKRKYGISLKEWEILYLQQNGACLICGKLNKKLTVDHDHNTERVRGLLCYKCNTSLSGYEYLQKFENKVKNYLTYENKIQYT